MVYKHIGKKFYNNLDTLVDESLEGLIISNNGLSLLRDHKVVFRTDIDEIRNNQVTIVSGGGSGHEPSHSGFVGDGMLSAAVCGNIFASPSSSQIFAAIQQINSSKGVLVIVKNYTGDRLQFGKAIERAKRLLKNDKIKMIIVKDDSSIKAQNVEKTGKRGLAGVVLVHKIAGYFAKIGKSLDFIYDLLFKITQDSSLLSTVGVGLTPCSLPGAEPSFQLDYDEMEFGLGIHGESGTHRLKIQSSFETCKLIIDRLLENINTDSIHDEYILLINNLGSTTTLELNLIVKDSVKYMNQCNVKITHVVTGTVMTSLEMGGISITLLKSKVNGIDLIPCINSKVNVIGWPNVVSLSNIQDKDISLSNIENRIKKDTKSITEIETHISTINNKYNDKNWINNLLKICNKLKENEEELNRMDRICGDGDCGNSIKLGSDSLINFINSNREYINKEPNSLILARLSSAIESAMGGSSGAFISILFDSAAQMFAHYEQDEDKNLSQFDIWIKALKIGTESVMYYGGAKIGDRTFLDSLVPSINELESTKGDLLKTYECSKLNALKTKEMTVAKVGRSSYISKDILKGVVDPGAFAVSLAFDSIRS